MQTWPECILRAPAVVGPKPFEYSYKVLETISFGGSQNIRFSGFAGVPGAYFAGRQNDYCTRRRL